MAYDKKTIQDIIKEKKLVIKPSKKFPVKRKCKAGGNGGFKIKKPTLRDFRCNHEYFIKDDYYYREINTKSAVLEFEKYLEKIKYFGNNDIIEDIQKKYKQIFGEFKDGRK